MREKKKIVNFNSWDILWKNCDGNVVMDWSCNIRKIVDTFVVWNKNKTER